MDISGIASNLDKNANGIWVARNQHEVSYPDDGNETCFEIEDASYWFNHRNNVISLLVSRFSPSATFFDIGGGNGCVSKVLQDRNTDVVLVEPGPAGALNATKRGVHTVIQSTFEDAGFAPETIPSAGVFDVVEHIEDDVQFLKSVNRYLQPGGTLYVTVPAYQTLWSNDDVIAGHYRRYTTSLLSDTLAECGFTIKYCSYLFSFLVPPIFLLRSIPSQFGLRKSVSVETTRNEHTGGEGLIHSVIQWLLRRELKKVEKGKTIKFGSSCIVVATKPH